MVKVKLFFKDKEHTIVISKGQFDKLAIGQMITTTNERTYPMQMVLGKLERFEVIG